VGNVKRNSNKNTIDFKRYSKLPYLTIGEIVEIFFGLDEKYLNRISSNFSLKNIPEHHRIAAKTYLSFLDWIDRDIQSGNLLSSPSSDSGQRFTPKTITDWAFRNEIITWLIDHDVQVPVEAAWFLLLTKYEYNHDDLITSSDGWPDWDHYARQDCWSFDEVVSILIYSRVGQSKKIFDCLSRLIRSHDPELNEVTLSQRRTTGGEPLFIPHKTITWAQKRGIVVHSDLLKYFNLSKQTKSESAEPKRGFLPAPAGTKWNEVRIEITADTQIRIGVKNKTQVYSLDKFKKEIITQKKMREYLFKIIQFGGIFTQGDIAPDTEKGQFRNYISRLRKKLQEVFGIQDDPLPFQKQNYHAKFKPSWKIKI